MNTALGRNKNRISILLLTFIIVVAVYLWFIDLMTMQRTFGFLLSAELVAFASLVYVYRIEPPERIRKAWLLVGFVVLVLLVLLSVIAPS